MPIAYQTVAVDPPAARRRRVMARAPGALWRWCMGFLVMGLVCVSVPAVPYGAYDIRELLSPSDSGVGGRFDGRRFDGMLEDLARHAGDYPPRFDSPADRRRAERDVLQLTRMLDTLFADSPPEPVLLRMAMLGAIGHNLGLAQAAAYAQLRFSQLLGKSADHPVGNYQYGRFLASAARVREALPYLEKARALNQVAATYSLGLAYLALDDRARALAYLTEYQRAVPSDGRVGSLIQAVREGRVEVNRSGRP